MFFFKRPDSNFFPYYFRIKNFPKLLFPKFYIKRYYKQKFGTYPNLDAPKLFSEKLQVLKLKYANNSDVVLAGDKVGMRHYTKKKKLEKLLVPIVGIYDSVEQINWTELPNEFVMKKSNASGQMFTIKNKEEVDRDYIWKQMRIWQKIDFGQNLIEPHYRKMKSRIIVEHYLPDIGEDWRIFFFQGSPKFIQIDSWVDVNPDRIIGHKKRIRIWSDMEGNIIELLADKEIEYVPFNKGNQIKLPNDFDNMIEYGKILSSDFPLVRVDFFHSGNKLFLGELTFTPGGGYQVLTPTLQESLGELLTI